MYLCVDRVECWWELGIVMGWDEWRLRCSEQVVDGYPHPPQPGVGVEGLQSGKCGKYWCISLGIPLFAA